MKLMLVGSANAGKTTLLLELTKKGKMVHQRPVQIGVNGLPLSTVGVELGEWEYSVTRNLPVITFMTWDFGGQVGSLVSLKTMQIHLLLCSIITNCTVAYTVLYMA